jgi:PadR family transcriptional regulator PadR
MANIVAYLILKSIDLHPEQNWGYEIKQYIEELTQKKIPEGTLYPLLTKFEKRGFLSSRKSIVPEKSKRERRYYTLTEKGRVQLASWPLKWNEIIKKINTLMNLVEENK